MAFNKAIALLLVLAVAAAPAAQAIVTAPLNSNTNVRCCGTSPGNCVDTGALRAFYISRTFI